jgi:voltage-gated potassium channel
MHAEPRVADPASLDWQRRVRRVRIRAVRAFTMFGGESPADAKAEGPRVARWQSRTEWPLAVLAGLFLAGYTTQVLARGLDHSSRTLLNTAVWAIYALFGVDFVVRAALARRHARYVWRHLADLIIIALPMLRPLRILRLIMLMRMLNRRLAETLRGRVVIYGAFTAVLLIFCASLAVLQAERGHRGANITGFGDALWWSIVTICTVGYGDRFPVTVEGRVVGAGLMISGVGLFGVVTASFAAWLVDQLRDEETDSEQATQADLAAVREQLDRIERRLDLIGVAAAPSVPAKEPPG